MLTRSHRAVIRSAGYGTGPGLNVSTPTTTTFSFPHRLLMTLSKISLPQVDWSITLPETITFHERHNADVPLYVLARHGLDDPPNITYGQFARACRRVPRLLGLSKEDVEARPVIAILANTDTLIYHTILLGLMLVGAIVSVILFLKKN